MSNELEFEQIDADAVCESCGTVNPEETLLCKTCGNNLKEQRQRRISSNFATPPPVSARTVSLRALTGLLSVLGILVILFVVLNLADIEAALVEAMSGAPSTSDVWSGETGRVLDEMALELNQYPSSNSDMFEAISNALVEDSFNGRYVIVTPSDLSRRGIVGEANLRKIGDQVYFVAKPRAANTQIRGVAHLSEIDGTVKPIVYDSGAAEHEGNRFPVKGFSTMLQDGGHLAVGQADNGYLLEVLAFRIR